VIRLPFLVAKALAATLLAAFEGGKRQPARNAAPLRTTDKTNRLKRRNVRYWHKADIQLSPGNVRFWGKSKRGEEGRECLLMTLAV